MSTALTALSEHSRRLLTAVASAEDEALGELLGTREELLRQLQSAIAAGEAMDPAEVRVVQELEQVIWTALQERQDAVVGEIAALRHSRGAGVAYAAADAVPARYLDRAG